MIELDGMQYELSSPSENAIEAVNYVNTYLKNNNITNRDGEVIKIEVNATSPIYLLFLGIGYLCNTLQQLLFSVGKGMSIVSSSSRQLLDLAECAGFIRKQPSPTTITTVMFASAAGPMSISPADKLTSTYGGDVVVFSPVMSVTIPASGYAVVIISADIDGPFSIPANYLTGFDSPVPNFLSMTHQASLPGRNLESLASLRNRLMNRRLRASAIDSCMEELDALPGISRSNLVFNFDSSADLVIDGIHIPPRQGLLMIQGFNLNIATVFYKYLTCKTVQTESSIQQDWYTAAGQAIPVFFEPPKTVQFFVRIVVEGLTSDNNIKKVKTVIISLAGQKYISDPLYEAEIVTAFNNNITALLCVGVELSLDQTNWTFFVSPGDNGMLYFDEQNINVINVRDMQ